MPTAFLVDGSVPMMMIAERARTAIFGTFAMKSRIAMVTLDSIRNSTRRRRSYGSVANTGEIFVSWRKVVFRIGTIDDIIVDGLPVRLAVFMTIPWKVLDPLLTQLHLSV
ncbi:hypothetical protein Hypma_012858 [Hypsizygus marmoreus]|uniref:Uncharacterized protein n=1 Tax=Hypsizygus marmoreus TaxID=39966 RepID=A0A369JD98_HYPMA|nr:hypothetical protein Hypma_012858 [Hypsizygus marmoreus]